MNLGVYCETLTPDFLAAPDVLRLLGRFGATLGHALHYAEVSAIRPGHADAHLELGARVREAGGAYCLWPLVPKPLGYWVNERNLDIVERIIDAILADAARLGLPPDWIVFDIEPPWPQMAAAFFPGPPRWRQALAGVGMLAANRRPRRFAAAARRLQTIVDRVRSAGVRASCAVFPFLIADLVAGGSAFQDYLETPIFPVDFDAYNAMFYNSYLPVAAPFLVPPPAAARFLYEYGRELTFRFPERAWVTLGSVWEGVIPGNEGKTYHKPSQLVADAAAAKGAGAGALWLYCLEGVLFADQALTQRRSADESAAFFEVMRDTRGERPPAHAGWTNRRGWLERVARDRLSSRYDW